MESLAGSPEMLPVARETHWIRRALTAVLGVPLAAQEMADDDSQGSLGIYFHRGTDRHGRKSREVMAITNKRIPRRTTSTVAARVHLRSISVTAVVHKSQDLDKVRSWVWDSAVPESRSAW